MSDINCDQVAWLLDVFDRYLPSYNLPSISRERELMKLGMLYEVMEIANLSFSDAAAIRNGTPLDIRNTKKRIRMAPDTLEGTNDE